VRLFALVFSSRSRRIGGVLAIILLLAGCAYPNQFRNADRHSPHALLVGKSSVLLVDWINTQKTTFWRCQERYRIPPGPTSIKVLTGFWDRLSYLPIEFTARAGCRYTLRHTNTKDVDKVFVWEICPDSAGDRLVAEMSNP